MNDRFLVSLNLKFLAGTLKVGVRYETISIDVKHLTENRLECTCSGQTTIIDLGFDLLEHLSSLLVVDGPLECSSFSSSRLCDIVLLVD